MRQTTKLWLPSLAVYGLFVLWYTDFSGPLNDEEVDHFVATLMAHNSAPETITYI